MDLLNALERSVHLHGLFTTSGGESVGKYNWPAKENKGLYASNDVFGITPQVVR